MSPQTPIPTVPDIKHTDDIFWQLTQRVANQDSWDKQPVAMRTWTQVTTSHYSVQHDWSREPERSTWISPEVTLVKADKVPRRGNFPNLGLILKLWFEIFILGTHSYILIAISNHHLLAYGFEPTFESSGLCIVFRIKLREKFAFIFSFK